MCVLLCTLSAVYLLDRLNLRDCTPGNSRTEFSCVFPYFCNGLSYILDNAHLVEELIILDDYCGRQEDLIFRLV